MRPTRATASARARAATPAAFVVAALLAGCGTLGSSTASRDLPVGAHPLDRTSGVWVAGTTAHLGDRTVELKVAPEVFVAGATGLYYLSDGVLRFADASTDRWFADVGTRAQLRISSDGRYLGYVDFGATTGRRPAQVVVYDTITGEQLQRTDVGNGSEGDKDLLDLYAEATPTFLGFDESGGYTLTASTDVYRYPLDGSKPENLGHPDEQTPANSAGGTRIWIHADTRTGTYRRSRNPDDTTDAGSLSPGGEFATANSWGPKVFFDVAGGREVVVRSGFRNLLLGTWTSGHEFLGVGFNGKLGAEHSGSGSAVLTCSLRSTRCETVARLPGAGLAGADVLFGTGEPPEPP